MVTQTRWTERRFSFGIPPGLFPPILERFRGTPARVEELVGSCDHTILTRKPDNAWSIQEHAGHLLDLEELGRKRLSEFLSRAATLSAADMSNRKTHGANHNATPISRILQSLRQERTALVKELEALDEVQVSATSLHPRLKQNMSVVDWVSFMCEHDDHHIARITWLRRHFSS